MLETLNLLNVLFLDIETVSTVKKYDDLSEDFKYLWGIKARQLARKKEEDMEEGEVEALYQEKAGIYAEFGRIICISVGIVVKDAEGRYSVRLKSFADKDEAALLRDFANMLDQYYGNPNKHFICGHNVREFDIPYICRRMVINQLPLPGVINIAGKKPWETKHLLDTMELWKFGDYKNYTSLKLLAAVLGFPSPKDDIDGSEVGRVFWEEDDLERIAVYCEKDVLAVVQLLLRYMRQPILEDDQIVFVGREE
jgi:DNA polymerase elongation subunit (family B)